MKKIFTLLTALVLVFALGANAQSRKTWDFTKGVSEESRALLDEDDANWSKTVTEGVSTQWTTNVKVTGELTAKGTVLKEFSGLTFGDFGATNALAYKVNGFRLQKAASFTLPALKAGQKIAFTAQSANATATDRGFLVENAVNEAGESSIIFPGESGLMTVTLTVQGDGVVKFSTGLTGTPAAGLDIRSIVIDEGDKNIKRWDFTNLSEATKAQILGAEDWTTAENATKNYITGDEIRWSLNPVFDANEDLTAGGSAIKEMKGLRHANLGAYGFGVAFNYANTLDGNNWGTYHSGSYLWVMAATSTITVPNVKAGSTFKIGVETHKLIPAGTSEARGFTVKVNGVEVGETQKATEYQEFEYAIPESTDEYVDVVLTATKGCHLYFIEAEVKDETVADKNPKLGEPAFSLKDGSKIAPSSTGFSITFPKFANLDPDTKITIGGFFGPAELGDMSEDDCLFDEVSGTVYDGITFSYTDFPCAENGLAENTAYKFYITSLVVDGYESLSKTAAEGENLYQIDFTTTGPGIETIREWAFTLSEEDAAELKASVDDGFGGWNASSKGRYSVSTKMFANDNRTLLVSADKPLSVTDGLLFSMSNDNDILVGTPSGNNGKLQLGGGTPVLTIPSCSAGDEITIKALWSTKNKGKITIVNGVAEDGTNVITLTGTATEYKIKVSENGDLDLKSSNTIYNTISIWPASMAKKEVNYTINAVDPDGVILKTLATGTAFTNDQVKVNYSYWLANADGDVFTNGVKGTPFSTSFTIGDEDVINMTYKATEMKGAVLCKEAEDIAGTTECSHANMAIRSSNCKAAYNESDIVIATLQPGSYKIAAILFDANGTPSYVASFKLGNTDAAPIELYASSTNWTEAESELFEVTEPTELIWTAGGTANAGLDAIVVYPSDDAPEPDPDGINGVSEDANSAFQTKAVVKDGKVVIITSNGEYTAAGAKIK